MNFTNPLVVLGTAWLATGLLLGIMMKLRGHDFYVWLLLGSILGPLAIPLAFQRIAKERSVGHTESVRKDGDFDVLVALDGSDESMAALKSALPMMMSTPTSFTFATVLDYDTARQRGEPERAKAFLEDAAKALPDHRVSTEVLFGRPARTLVEYADSTAVDLIVLGARGKGASKQVFGSVANAVVKDSEIPVMVGPRPTASRLPYMSPD